MTDTVFKKLFALPDEITQSDIFREAMTHRSAAKKNNERLEFLGDAVLGLTMSRILFERFPECDEGDLSRLRAHLVCKRALTEIAIDHKLSEVILLGAGERKTGGHKRDSILADAVEAAIAAVYRLKDFDYAFDFVQRIYAEQLQNLPDTQSLKDPKTRLQEYLQGLQIAVPAYETLSERGEANDKTFHIECKIAKLNLRTESEGKSKKKAEQTAAALMIEQLLSEASGK
ncbi:MAG: ribonuclease III [Gammaproteobacteria bacterium]|nr:ribonuclease III [Gammaproteobacteria bacterium]